MTEGSLVSVVMPAWNPNPEWLRQSVSSVLGEGLGRVELVVVDDGSIHPVEELLAEVDDPRLRVVRVDHGGVSRARNAGLSHVGGDYVRFVDCDDVVEPASASRLLALAGPATIAYGATQYCDAELRPSRTMTCELQGDVLKECLVGRLTVRLIGLLFPRAVVDAVEGWDESLSSSEDWDFVLRALEHADVRGERAVAGRYRKHADSVTGDPRAVAQGVIAVVDRYVARHQEIRGSRLERDAYLHARLVAAQVHRGDADEYLRGLMRVLALSPNAAVREAVAGVPPLVRGLAARARRARRERSAA